jgi:hypothetical protein
MEKKMTDTTTINPVANEIGKAGRPLSSAARRSRLRLDFINKIGLPNITPAISEAILSATELTVMAADLRKKISKNLDATAEDMTALVRIENSAARAVARLGLPAPRGSVMHVEAINTNVSTS